MQVVLKKRGSRSEFLEVWSAVVDPSAPTVERSALPKLNVWAVMQNGPPSDKVDLLLLADGYTLSEMSKTATRTGWLRHYSQSRRLRLSGRTETEDIERFQQVLILETPGRSLLFDLRDVTLVQLGCRISPQLRGRLHQARKFSPPGPD